MAQTQPKVFIIVLNWNGKDNTIECLTSLAKLDYPNIETIVVDNDSSDDSVPHISNSFPDIKLIQSGDNLGYAGGNNVGIEWALKNDSDYILILNNDTIVAPDLIDILLQSATTLPQGSILGAQIFYQASPDKIWFAGGRWDSDTLSFQHIGQNQSSADTDFNEITKVDYITGCALFSSSATFHKVGLLDENFYLTFEETDWCYRAKKLDYDCYMVPQAKLWHKVASSFGGRQTPIYEYFMNRNKYLWAEKHLPVKSLAKLHYISLSTFFSDIFPAFHLSSEKTNLVKRIVWSMSTWNKSFQRNISNPMYKARFMGYRDYYLRNFGNCPNLIREMNKSSV